MQDPAAAAPPPDGPPGSDPAMNMTEDPPTTKKDEGRLLGRQESLMEGVRQRLQTSTQAFLVPGVTPVAGATGYGNAVKHRLKERKTCGREVTVSFRALLLCGITVVMAATMAALLATQIVISRDVSNSLISTCNEATNAFLNTTVAIVLDSLVFIAREQMLDASDSLRVFLIHQAQAQVGTTYNSIATSYTEFDLAPNSAFFNKTKGFMSAQMKATYSDWIDVVSVGVTDSSNRYLDVSLCHEDPLGTSFGPSSVGSCPFTTATTNQTTLVRCTDDISSPCKQYSNFSVADQLPVATQLAFRATQPANTTAMLMWSTPYVLQGIQFNFRQTLSNMMGVGLSYPVFNDSCQSYSCASRFVWSVITARSFAAFSRNAVMGRNVSNRFNSIQNDSVFFVVEGRGATTNGLLLGGAFGNDGTDLTIVPSVPLMAADSSLPVISKPSQYVIQEFGSFLSTALDDLVIDTFNPVTLEKCNSSSPDDDLILQLSNCTLIAVISVHSPETVPQFHTLAPARFVVVYSIPLKNLMSPLMVQLVEAQKQINDQRLAQEDAIESLVGVGIGVAVAAIVLGILVAWLMAVRVSVPLQKLDRRMRNLMNFNFRVAEDDYLSRVSDIGRAEKTLESLSDAIEVFSKFVPETVVRGIVQGKPESTRLHVEHRVVTVAFSDIKGFTSISEKLEISDLLFFLTRYLTVMTEVVQQYEGTVTEILGDGLLVLWNAPDDCELHAAKACAAALAMQAAVKHVANEFHSILSMHGLENLSVRVGIHTGRVLAGNIGSTTKLKYGCLGDTVNTASRLEGLCKLYEVGIICSKDTIDMLPPNSGFQYRELDLVQVKGKDQALALFEIEALRNKLIIPGAANGREHGAEAPRDSYHGRPSTRTKNLSRLTSKAKSMVGFGKRTSSRWSSAGSAPGASRFDPSVRLGTAAFRVKTRS